MSSFKRSVPVALAGAGAAVAALLAAGPASALPVTPAAGQAPAAAAAPATAAKPWTISKGGLAVAVAQTITVNDTTVKLSISCYLSTMKLDLKSGKKLPGSDAGTMSAAVFGECTLPKGLPLKVAVAGLPWHVNLRSYDAADGVTSGTLTGMHVGLSVPEIGCTALGDGTAADAHDGSLAATYSNKTGTLKTLATGGALRLYDVSSHCYGLIKDGDSLSLSGSYKVAPGQKITAS
jgi:hypothetical protein